VDAGAGHVIAFASALRHAGHPISKGKRMVMVLFAYVDGANASGLKPGEDDLWERLVQDRGRGEL
jgi:hypothetical protein